ncbi:hypothetical protein [Gemmata sp.]|uniref:GTPase domain-containing protein n=1 Tax=Gemmata sp. TaxID=1914242 RepID=UPI003F726639
MAIPLPPDPHTPQVLLFGHSGAGKSAILGALLKVSETQGPALGGEVVETSGRLATIRDAVYRGTQLEPASAELTSYPVRLRPWREGTRALGESVTVVVNDCSGRAAESLILHPEAIRDPATRAPVARAVIDADAIVLMVDGAADDDELREAFEEFDTFLTIVAQAKVNAREVGGFPIFLVLTKCDGLARPDDTLESWTRRVEQRADRAWAKFDKFLKDAEPDDGIPSPFLPFGNVELNVIPVAVRHPRVPGAPADPDEPFNVAELFRGCFAGAKGHRDRVLASDRRLWWTLRLAMGFVGFLLLSVAGMLVFQPQPTGPDLAERIRSYEQHEPEAEVRLAYPALTRNKNVLAGFREEAGFGSVPDDLHRFVLTRLKEIADYEAFREKLLTFQAPDDTRTLGDLARVEQGLNGELALPPHYAWGRTTAAELRRKWLADAAAIRTAEAEFFERYRDFVRRGTVLTYSASLGGNWRAEVGALLAEAARPPVPLNDPLPGSPALEQLRGKSVTYWVPYNFERVDQGRRNWEFIRDRLVHLRDLGDAVGLTAGPDRPEAVFVLPEPGPTVDSAKLVGDRLAALLRSYPRETEDYSEWQLRNFRDPSAPGELAERLDRALRTGGRHVHALLRERLGPNPEQRDTPEAWRATAAALADPATPFPEWGRFLFLIAKVRADGATNPVAELAAFLHQDKFDMNPAGFDVVLPLDLGLNKVAPNGPLAITVVPQGGQPTTRAFKQAGGGVREGAGTSYRFAAEGDARLTYRPGDEFRAELPVRVGTQDCKLVWETAATRAYQFDKLAHEPRLVKPGGGSEPGTGVRVTPTGGSPVPRLPALFPNVAARP